MKTRLPQTTERPPMVSESDEWHIDWRLDPSDHNSAGPHSLRSMLILLVLAITFAAVAPISAKDPERSRAPILAKLKKLTDPQLGERLHALLAEDKANGNEYDSCLTEITSRGGEYWAKFLREEGTASVARNEKRRDQFWGAEYAHAWNLELLTALRRVEKKPDPLTILVESPNPLVVKASALPDLKVTIKNVDYEKLPVAFQAGGDYRSGRQARWRLSVANEKHEFLPSRQMIWGIGGGMFQCESLTHGEAWETVLDARSFIDPPHPGRYRLEVLYHDSQTIADMPDVQGLIVTHSAPITLVIEPTEIVLTRREEESARRLIAVMKPADRVKVVAGTYGPWAHDFISPEAPEGKLLAMGLKAVPPLMASFDDNAMTDVKRAWVLSLLFSLTGENDPRDGGALGPFESREGPWQVLGGRPGQPLSGGFGISSQLWIRGAKADSTAQQELIKKWREWITYAKVTYPSKCPSNRGGRWHGWLRRRRR